MMFRFLVFVALLLPAAHAGSNASYRCLGVIDAEMPAQIKLRFTRVFAHFTFIRVVQVPTFQMISESSPPSSGKAAMLTLEAVYLEMTISKMKSKTCS